MIQFRRTEWAAWENNFFGGFNMYHYEYVSKKQAAPYKAELIEIINKVQDEVRDDFTFQFTFIGSSSRNMITFDPTTNIGFDFDVNIEVILINRPCPSLAAAKPFSWYQAAHSRS